MVPSKPAQTLEEALATATSLSDLLGPPAEPPVSKKPAAAPREPPKQTLAEMIAACKFAHTHHDINERNFPPVGEVANVSDMLAVTQKDLGGEEMTTIEVEAAIARKGYRCATLAELLAYAKAKWNGSDPVVALGYSWSDPCGRRCVPYLYDGGRGRELGLIWGIPEYRWHENVLFLVVRK